MKWPFAINPFSSEVFYVAIFPKNLLDWVGYVSTVLAGHKRDDTMDMLQDLPQIRPSFRIRSDKVLLEFRDQESGTDDAEHDGRNELEPRNHFFSEVNYP